MCKYQSSRYRLFYVFYTYIIISALVSYTMKYQRVDMLTLDDRMDYLYINHLTYGITKFYRETHFVTCPNSCQQNYLNARGQEKVSVSLLSEENPIIIIFPKTQCIDTTWYVESFHTILIQFCIKIVLAAIKQTKYWAHAYPTWITYDYPSSSIMTVLERVDHDIVR